MAVIVTKFETLPEGYHVARAVLNGVGREFDDRHGSWMRDVNRRFPEDRTVPQSVTRREASRLVAQALQAKLPAKERAKAFRCAR